MYSARTRVNTDTQLSHTYQRRKASVPREQDIPLHIEAIVMHPSLGHTHVAGQVVPIVLGELDVGGNILLCRPKAAATRGRRCILLERAVKTDFRELCIKCANRKVRVSCMHNFEREREPFKGYTATRSLFSDFTFTQRHLCPQGNRKNTE